jgi:Tfp pilus assembly protein PilO
MPKKYKIIILVCVAVVFCNFIVTVAVMDKQAQKISVLQRDISGIRRADSVRPGKKSNPLEVLKFDIDNIFQKIPDEFSFTPLAATLRILVDKNHLVAADALIFRPKKTDHPLLITYYTKFSINGEYGKIKAFISDLQNLPGLLYLDTVKIVRLKENETRLKLSLGISIFFKKRSA